MVPNRSRPYTANTMNSMNSFGTRTTFQGHTIHSLPALEKKFPQVSKLPFSMKVLLENLLRREDGAAVTAADIEAVAKWGVIPTSSSANSRVSNGSLTSKC